MSDDTDQPPQTPPPQTSARVDAFKAVIGPTNQDYYLSYFRRAEERGYAPASWNWPAFFLSFFWLLWRRQYQWAIFTLGLAVASTIVGSIISTQTGSLEAGRNAAYLLYLPFRMVYLPLKANGIYYAWCKQMIELAAKGLPGQVNKQQAWLTQRGGVNNNLPLAIFIAFLLLSLIAVPPGELATQ